jgi:DNA-directed RNA polymerase specialized sigma24 family protein
VTITAADLGLADAPLYYVMAKQYVDDPNLWDDCVQEAAIHVWRLRQRPEAHPPAYYRKAARRRITEVAQRQTWFGYESHRGHPIDPLRRPHDSYDQLVEGWLREESQ